MHMHRIQFKRPRSHCISLFICIRTKSSSCGWHDVVESGTFSSSISETQNPSILVHKPRNCNHNAPRLFRSSGKVEANGVSIRFPELNEKERLRGWSGMLRTCASNGRLNEGRAVHGQVIKNCSIPDSHLWVSLVNMYAKCRGLVYGRRMLDLMPDRDVVSWTTLITGFVSEGCGREGISLFCEMYNDGFQPNEFTMAAILKACYICSALCFGKQVHAEVIKIGLDSDLYIGSALIALYAECGDIALADRVFFSLPARNAVSWNVLLNGYAQMGDGKNVLKLFSEMTEQETKFSKFTLSTVLKGFANSKSLREAKVVHSLVIKTGNDLDEFVGGSLADMYTECGLSDDALSVFLTIRDPDIVVWTTMIACLDQHGKSQESAQLFNLMRRSGVIPNQYTLAALVKTSIDLGSLRFGENIHGCIHKYGFKSDNPVNNALITMYMKMGCMEQGMQVFDAMKDHDLVSWNAFLSGFIEGETYHQGPAIFKQILEEGFKPNTSTFSSVLKSCSNVFDAGFGKQVHAHIIKNTFDSDIYVAQALIDMYAKNKLLEDAEIFFKNFTKRDLKIWTTIITNYAQTDQAEKAIKCLRQMQREAVKPNEFTLPSCLSGCAHISALSNGQQLHCLASKLGQLGDTFVSTALVDMYAKCGCIVDAEAVFKDLISQDTISWNALICGYSKHGLGEKALEAYSMMLDEDISPDEVTFIGVLSACNHTGLIEEGKKHFHTLKEVYGFTPRVEHYACMVDILGRAGQFNEVASFITEMNLSAIPVIWESVLGACKIHGNVEYGKRAANKLFELEPEMDSNYILLSNIFAAKCMWDDFRKARILMSSRGVKKVLGCSWVEVNGVAHVFVSQDCSHYSIRDIHLKLEELGQKLILAGYTPKPEEREVCDRTDTVTNEDHFYHSEKLALAFALISSSPITTIRIFKTLRICGDCHDFIKLASEIINREIVVRDMNRFHHFKNGTCSCLDYW